MISFDDINYQERIIEKLIEKEKQKSKTEGKTEGIRKTKTEIYQTGNLNFSLLNQN